MGIGKTKRFEIFKRDGFTCQYCGNRPPEVILEVDHIHPVAGGGLDDDLNLITACFDCNRGKRDRVLANVGPKPDADIEYLRVQQERVEAERYVAAKAARDASFELVTNELNNAWAQSITQDYVPVSGQWRTWLNKYSPDEIESAIHKAAYAHSINKFGYDEQRAVPKACRYVNAILRNQREEAGDPFAGKEPITDAMMLSDKSLIEVGRIALETLVKGVLSEPSSPPALWNRTNELWRIFEHESIECNKDELAYYEKWRKHYRETNGE